jgi:hypothetical protein
MQFEADEPVRFFTGSKSTSLSLVKSVIKPDPTSEQIRLVVSAVTGQLLDGVLFFVYCDEASVSPLFCWQHYLVSRIRHYLRSPQDEELTVEIMQSFMTMCRPQKIRKPSSLTWKKTNKMQCG